MQRSQKSMKRVAQHVPQNEWNAEVVVEGEKHSMEVVQTYLCSRRNDGVSENVQSHIQDIVPIADQ